MKERELMIGDLVTYTGDDEGPITASIEGINEDSDFGIEILGTCERIEDIEPIHLTAEILEKNIPFERYWDASRSNPNGSVTEWRKDTKTAIIFVWDFRDQKGEYILEIQIRGCENYGVKKNIYYVHELQHAMRLCGLNELADNFKI